MSSARPSQLIDYCLERWASEDPTREAFLDATRRITYREALDLTANYARALLQSGISPGDRIGVMGFSRIDCFIVFLACAWIGAIYVGTNPKYRARELEHVVSDSTPRLLLMMTTPTSAHDVSRLLETSPGMTPIALDRDVAHRFGWRTLDEWLERGGSVLEAELSSARHAVTDEDPAAIIYTSGTTGSPKGALIPHRALIHAASLSRESFWKGVPRTLVDLPINHVGWLVETCLAAVYAGGTLFFRERFDPRETLRLVEQERLNALLLISSMLIACFRTEEFQTLDLSSIDHLLFVAPVEADVLAQFQRRCGATLVTGLGMTETAGGYTFTDDDADLATVVNTVGRVDPSVEVKLVDEEGRRVDAGTPGEILVRGKSLFLRYLNRPDSTAEAFDEEGFFRTGDVAILQEDGNLRVVGRRKEMFKSGGYNVYPTEIEMVLAEHEGVSAVAVVPVEDQMWGEVGVAFVMPRANAPDLSQESLKSFASERLANYKIPKRFLVVSDLPILPNGKIDRSSLKGRVTEVRTSLRG